MDWGPPRGLPASAGRSPRGPPLEPRTLTRRQLREAIELDPQGRAGNPWELLGRVREMGGFDSEAADSYRNALAREPGLREAFLALGLIERRRYLLVIDHEALRRAIADVDSATRCFPPSSEPWLSLVPLLYELPDRARARLAADEALRLRPRLPESGIAAGMMAYRTGDLERADSLFRAWIPRLPAVDREVFEHPGRHIGRLAQALARRAPEGSSPLVEPGPVAPGPPVPDDLPDPDPTTPENEVRLEYWARAAHALLLFRDPVRPGEDDRAMTYLRYGPPAKVL